MSEKTTRPPTAYVTVKEAAEILRVDQSTCRRYIAQGILAAIRIGRTTLRVDMSSLKFEPIGGAA